jgi:hypothetical protein
MGQKLWQFYYVFDPLVGSFDEYQIEDFWLKILPDRYIQL